MAARAWSDFCDLASTAVGARVFACLQVPALAPAYQRFPVCDGVAASIAAGRVTLRREALPACLQLIDGMACDAFLRGLVPDFPCPEVLIGAVPSGGHCFQDLDCADPEGQSCLGGDACRATCHPRRSPGDACAASAECGTGLLCGGTCVRRALDGEPCGAGLGMCALGLACTAGLCAPQIPDAPCSGGLLECGLSLRCDPQNDTCQPNLVPSAPCAPGACLAGASCRSVSNDAQAICVPNPAVGQACSVALSGTELVEEAVCNGGYCDRSPGALSGTCQPYKNVGDSCAADKECNPDAGRACRGGVCATDTCGESW